MTDKGSTVLERDQEAPSGILAKTQMTFLETSNQTDQPFLAEPSTTLTTRSQFTAIMGSVSCNINQCELTYREREEINYPKACAQLEEYRRVLRSLGVNLICLDPVNIHPDCCFVQDTAVVLDEVCVIASMGAPSRAGETKVVEKLLSAHRPIQRILAPATLDGGDVVPLGKRIFVGASRRTNARGITRFKEIVEPFGYSVVPVTVNGSLHLTTSCGVVNDETVILNPRWLDATAFKDLRQLHVGEEEPWAANTVRINSTVCVEQDAPRTVDQIRPYVSRVEVLDISEFRKAEGSLSCLSLIFENQVRN